MSKLFFNIFSVKHKSDSTKIRTSDSKAVVWFPNSKYQIQAPGVTLNTIWCDPEITTKYFKYERNKFYFLMPWKIKKSEETKRKNNSKNLGNGKLPLLVSNVFFKKYLFIWLFGGQTQQCSGASPGFSFRNCLWQAGGPKRMPGIKLSLPWLAACKANCCPIFPTPAMSYSKVLNTLLIKAIPYFRKTMVRKGLKFVVEENELWWCV